MTDWSNLAAKVRATPGWVLLAWLLISAVVYWWAGGYIVFGLISGCLLGLWWQLTKRYDWMIPVNLLIASLLRRR